MTIEDHLIPHSRGRGSTVPTDERNYAKTVKLFLAFLAPGRYIDPSSSADIYYLPENTSEYVKMSSWDCPKPQAAFTTLASVVVVLGAIVAQIINTESDLFPMIAALGLSVLAAIVFAHQQ